MMDAWLRLRKDSCSASSFDPRCATTWQHGMWSFCAQSRGCSIEWTTSPSSWQLQKCVKQVFSELEFIRVCFVNLVQTKGVFLNRSACICSAKCSSRVRPASAPSAHDTMLSDAKASRSGTCASRVRRACHFCEREAARRLELPTRAHLRCLVFISRSVKWIGARLRRVCFITLSATEQISSSYSRIRFLRLMFAMAMFESKGSLVSGSCCLGFVRS